MPASFADFSNWAVVGHKDDSGFGRQLADLKAILKIKKQIVIPSERLHDHTLDPNCEVLLDPTDSLEKVRQCLQGIEGIIFPERSDWHQSLLPTAASLGIKVICVPNWEWFRGKDKLWQHCDLFVCQSKFTEEVVQTYGWQNTVHIPVALDIEHF